MSDFSDRIREATAELREARLNLRGIEAQAQQLATRLQAAMAMGWEDRYMAEGFIELEQHANGEAPK